MEGCKGDININNNVNTVLTYLKNNVPKFIKILYFLLNVISKIVTNEYNCLANTMLSIPLVFKLTAFLNWY